MKTSCFKKAALLEGAISIARSARFYSKKVRGKYLELAPTAAMLKDAKEDPLGGRDRYDQAFELILQKLDPQQVWNDLHEMVAPAEPILLCFEAPPLWCHRRMVAEWLEDRLGVTIPELGIARSLTPLYRNMPADEKDLGPQSGMPVSDSGKPPNCLTLTSQS